MLQKLSFHVVGVSHHTAAVNVREQFAFTPDELAVLLAQEQTAGRSALLLFTCNRCELYWCGPHGREAWFRDLAEGKGLSLDGEVVQLDGYEAVRHLFTVSAGLDSQILGETEILGQVRRAYDAARAAGSTTRAMDAIFSAALAAGRRVRRETMLGRHPASVSSAAVELAATEWGDGFGDRQVVVLGAGEAAEGVLRSLHLHGASRVALVNRSPDRARVLASAWGAEPHAWGDSPGLIAAADLLIVATSATRPVVSAERLSAALAGRPERRLVVIDLGVPRNVQPEARQLPGIQLFDLDDLQRLCCPAGEEPMASMGLARAEQILLEEMARLDLAMRGRASAPRLTELHRVGAEIAQREATWALSRLDGLSELEQQVVRDMAERLVRRVLYPVSRSIRLDEAVDPEAEEPLTA